MNATLFECPEPGVVCRWKEAARIRVHGEPKGQPRPRAFARVINGRPVARVYDSGTAEAWKSMVALAARDALPEQPLEGPLRLDLLLIFPRPKSHFGSGRNAGILKPGAPLHHTTKPDLDNAMKAVLDAMKTVGFFRDDAQICGGYVSKVYGEQPGAVIVLYVLDG